mgnify:CR=1 FL=1
MITQKCLRTCGQRQVSLRYFLATRLAKKRFDDNKSRQGSPAKATLGEADDTVGKAEEPDEHQNGGSSKLDILDKANEHNLFEKTPVKATKLNSSMTNSQSM